jgi:integrase
MPRPSKGPRLYLRRGRVDAKSGRPLPDVYFIRDGQGQVSTGCGPDSLPAAERQLAAFIAKKWTPEAARSPSRSDPAQVLIADVLAYYGRRKADKLRRDKATMNGFVNRLLDWWGERTLSDVTESNCEAYAAARITQPDARYKDSAKAPRVSLETARCELEVLSAAIGAWDREYHLTRRPVVTLPAKAESQRDALSRQEAASLLRAAMGHRRRENGSWERLGASAAANRAHLRRFLLIGLYTGSRHSVITSLLWEESATNAWVDLEKGMVFRRGKSEAERGTKRRPVVRLPARLLAHMRRWRAMDAKAATKDKPMLAVVHHGGDPLAGKVRTGFEGIVRDAGLDPAITPHWLRHTCVTWLMERGVDMWEAAAYAGMTVKVLEDHYAHHRPDHHAAARKALGVSGKVSGK